MTFAGTVFFASVIAVAYTFAGYALLLMIWARLAPRPVRQAPINPSVAIVVVVHNGSGLIKKKIDTCLAQDYPPEQLRVLIVSDGSDDETNHIVETFNDARVRLLPFPDRRGKAACLNDAVAACEEEIIVFTDVRQRLNPLAVRHLIDNFADSTVGAVSGQLMFERSGMTGFGESIDAYWRYEKHLRRLEGLIHSTVGVTGALYALRRSCFREIPPQTILDDVLIPMNTVLQGYRVIFEDGALAYDRPSTSASQERVRKVRTLAGNFQLLFAHPALLAPWRNPVLLQLISHKVMRLVAPLALLCAFVANIALVADANKAAFFRTTLALQAIGYAVAALGALWAPANGFRLIKLASAFVSLNWFVVLGFIEFISNRSPHLWKSHQVPSSNGRSTS